MLISLIFTLRPERIAALPPSHGGFAHAAALELFRRLDPKLAAFLHDSPGPKPFTVSQLLDVGEKTGEDLLLRPDETYVWRLTGLTAAVTAALRAVTPEVGSVRMGEATLAVEAVMADPGQHPWAGSASYADLFAQHIQGTAAPARRLRLQFTSPTTFRDGDVEQPFPLPRLVWRNYWQQWNLFGQPPLGELRDTLEETVVLGQWEGRTLRVHAGPRRVIGFVGTFDYYVRGRQDLWARILNLLADYAFYCGTGLATTYGMGQTRWRPVR